MSTAADAEDSMEPGPSSAETSEKQRKLRITVPANRGCKPVLTFNLFECQLKYDLFNRLGRGMYGSVFKATDKMTGDLVAIKRSRVYGKSTRILGVFREITCLEELRHDNVVNLIEYFASEKDKAGFTNFFLVLEYCEGDLYKYLQNLTTEISQPEIKGLSRQIMRGIAFIHDNLILHRDIKSQNILLTENGVAKIADFGLAKCCDFYEAMTQRSHTPTVVTLWYRPPELLLGEYNYDTGVDMWAIGCVLAELWTRQPILQGDSENDQIIKITDLCGSITTEVWPAVENLPRFAETHLPAGIESKLKDNLAVSIRDPLALDLISNLLSLDPSNRVTANTALENVYFKSFPAAVDLMKPVSSANKCRNI